MTSLLWGLWFGHRKTSPGRGEVLFLCSENLVAQGFRFMQKAHLKKLTNFLIYKKLRCSQMCDNYNNNNEKKEDEHQKNPFSNLRDTFDRAEFGDLRPLSKLGIVPTIVIFVAIVFLIWLFSKITI
ncbi:hypothetical protein KDJ56_17410 [Brevibacillus composti]|uniref:Uncharacterized protein n=1 Tax=Brevibacillus composti TaxID=2796470 RepID=A0A7T5EJE6_9BACL|nr:hypothetical protein [Brevibacillus composti]QQE73658.1 hypothetical protein JD108_17465 [Brevibacillus composti]QUO40740.1 hypothetical protein KDJ56_17410 [Brevibacillus composti]